MAVNRNICTYGTIIRILKLGGNLKFGKVPVGSKKTRILTISNKGNKQLKIKKVILPTGFKGSFKGIIKPGAKKKVRVTFSPKTKRALAEK